MRTFRTVISIALLLLGATLALAAVLDSSGELTVPVLMVLCGIVLVEMSAWKRANPLLPSERRNELLREQVDRIIATVRQLEATSRRAGASDDGFDWEESARLQTRLHAEVQKAVELAAPQNGRPNLT